MPTLEVLVESKDLLDNMMLTTRHKGDAGVDLYCAKDVIIPAHNQAVLEFGVRCRMLDENTQEYISYLLVPRSSISKTPLRMSNSVGIIDAGYRGTIMAYVDNIGSTPYVVKKGDRLFQIVHPTLVPLTVGIVDTLDTTSRGEGGFGSTGSAGK